MLYIYNRRKKKDCLHLRPSKDHLSDSFEPETSKYVLPGDSKLLLIELSLDNFYKTIYQITHSNPL